MLFSVLALLCSSALARAEQVGSTTVTLAAKNKGECDASFKTYLWIPRQALVALGMPTAKTCGGPDCGTVTIEGIAYKLDQINGHDGHDVCGACNCDLAYLNLAKGESFKDLKCGQQVAMSYERAPPPPPPPPPPPLPPPMPKGSSGLWERVGPRNIFDDESNRGESGTLATAASPEGNMNIIYTGGQNNGASSGVLKSVDMGATWVTTSNGLFDTRIQGLYVYPGDVEGKHVLCGTPSGIWESLDGAASWRLVPGTSEFGQAHTFRNASIGGEPHVLVSTSAGIANVNMAGGNWSLIKSEHGDWHSPLSVSDDGESTVVCGCLGGIVILGTVTSPTTAAWNELPAMRCAIAAIDPNDKTHFLFSNSTGWKVWESTDGGKTARDANFPEHAGSFYVAIDRRGWYYTGAEAGAFRSRDKGLNWEPFVVNMTSRYGFVDNRIPHDYQRISLDFGGSSVAFPSDQGLFIAQNNENTSLINACGNLSNNIAITVAVSEGEGQGKNYLVMTIWDWAPIASWNSGKNWPATTCNAWNGNGTGVNCDETVGYIGEGGAAYAFGRSNHMIMVHYHNIAYSSIGGKNASRFTLPSSAVAHDSKVVYTKLSGSRSEPDGFVVTVMKWDGNDDDDDVDDDYEDEEAEGSSSLAYMAHGELRDAPRRASTGQKPYVLKSENFGLNWTWTALPESLAATSVIQTDPTSSKTLYAIAGSCVSTSTDKGESWSSCLDAEGLEGTFTDLCIKDSQTMILIRSGAVPLRTKDGGKTWQPLTATSRLFDAGAHAIVSGSYSWSGRTLELHGKDMSAPSRAQYAGFVWRSFDDGDSFTDETDGIVTMAVNQGVWHGEDFYLTTSGEGILAKRNFDSPRQR